MLGSLNLCYEGEGKIKDESRVGGWNSFPEREHTRGVRIFLSLLDWICLLDYWVWSLTQASMWTSVVHQCVVVM